MRRNKRGSLSLSINAIVVLILAITMLGLGLGFIRTMFGKVSNIAEEQLAAEPDPVVPDATNPITISRDMVVMEKGTTRVIKLSVYCNQATGCSTTVPLATGSCAGFGTTATDIPTIVASALSGIGYKEHTKGTLVIKTVSATPLNTGSCTVSVTGIAIPAKAASFALQVK